MSSSKYTSVYQRPPIPVPSDWEGVRRMVGVLETVLDDIYRRYGRLVLKDLSEETSAYIVDANDTAHTADGKADDAQETADTANATANSAAADAAAARAVQAHPASTATQTEIDDWATAAYEEGMSQGLSGAELSAFIRAYIAERM